MVLNRKYVIMALLVVMIGVAGFLNWSYKKDNAEINVNKPITASTDKSKKLGEAQPANSEATESTVKKAREDRVVARGKAIELLNGIINNQSTTKEAKDKAQQAVMAIAKATEKEGIIEGLVKTKGFEEAVVFINDGKVNVVVKTKGLNAADTAKIHDIVTEHTGLTADKIKISEAKIIS